MASTYVNDLRLNEMATGDASGTWGEVTNTNLELIAEAFSYGTEAITTNADTHTTTIADGATDPGRSMYLKYTGTLDSTCTITIGPNTVSKMWFIENATSGSQNIIISQGSGANVTIPSGDVKVIYTDGAGSGAAVVDAFTDLNLSGTTTVAALDAGSGAITTTGTVTGNNLAGTLTTAAQPNITSVGTLTGLTTTGDINFGDNDKAVFGAGSDLQIYSDGTNSRIYESGSGLLIVRASNFNVNNADGSDSYITMQDGGAVTAYYDGSAKLATTSTGIDVTGTATATNMQVSNGGKYIFGGENTRITGETDGDGKIRLFTGGTEKVILDGSNVGIGTSSPVVKLTTESGVVRTTTAKTETAFFSSTDADDFRFGLVVSHKGGATDADRYASLDSTAYRISTDTFSTGGALVLQELGGNVGIGDPNPDNKLTIRAASTIGTVNGHIMLTGDSATNGQGPQIVFSESGSSSNFAGASVGYERTGSNGIGDLIFGTRATSGDASTVPTERMRIDSSGKVSTSGAVLAGASVNNFSPNKLVTGENTDGEAGLNIQTSATGTGYVLFGDGSGAAAYRGQIRYSQTDDTMNFHTVTTTRMTIDSAGKVSIGGSALSNAALTLENSANTKLVMRMSTATAGKYWRQEVDASNDFYIVNNGTTGVYLGDGSTSWSGISDENLKENIVELTGVLDKIKDYRCVEYNLISDETNSKKIGFIAQDWQEDYSQVVSQDNNGNLGIQYTETIPVLLKAIQEQQTIIESLEARITALES